MTRLPGTDDIGALLSPLGFDIASSRAIGGGDISTTCFAECHDGRRIFVKLGEAPVLAAEASGLNALQVAADQLVIPRTLASAAAEGSSALLVLEWLEPASPDRTHWEALGRGLAVLHRHTADAFGFHQNNFIGRLPQINTIDASWVSFFHRSRLEPQVRMAVDRGHWTSGRSSRFRGLEAQLDRVIPDDPPASLVHGDLWSGNAMSTRRGPAVVDPAVYYGHREVDLAMTELFGGFASAFYAAYRETYPLDEGYEVRKDLYNLYHLLNHLNHFGGGYGGSVDRILTRYAT